jgi:hypothetical protein
MAAIGNASGRSWTSVGPGIWKGVSQISERAARELMAERLDTSGSRATASRVRRQRRASLKSRESG